MTGIVVRPVRFTDNMAAMRSFLEVLGLRPRIASDSGAWIDMSAGGGLVALHDATRSDTGGAHGATRLSFESDDLDALAARLEAAGVPDVVIYDETYSRVLTCTDPLGDGIHIDERMDDLYGYRRLDAAKGSMSVLPVRFTLPTGPYGAFLEALGLSRVDEPNDFYVRYAASEDADGSVGLHFVYTDELPIVPGPAAAHLTLSSAEPMHDLADRLRAAGFDPTVTEQDFGWMLSVIDPDGQEIQVHEPAAKAP
jgi:predicted enzyme related to lactoylglutathione lyase